MRFLYVAPRYHTNQIPIMKGLTEHGHEVCFISHYQGKIEDYTYVTPVIAGYSKIFDILNWIYVHMLQRHNSKARNMKLKYGFPSIGKMRKIVSDFKPDVMIIRERSVYSIFTCIACRGLKVPMILYNQSPLWEEKVKNDLPHRIVRGLLPKVRITPVLGIKEDGYVKEDGAIFVPFVIEPGLSPEKKTWFLNGKINILCVAKYEMRKNIHMLLEVSARIAENHDLFITIVGECVDAFEENYKKEQEMYILEKGLEGKVVLLENLPYGRMVDLYRQADLFVLPSTREPASVSQLEAMSFSLPVICSNTNGSACYIEEGRNGYLFKDNCQDALYEVMSEAVSKPEKLKEMGKNSYEDIKKKCAFDIYYQKIIACIEKVIYD